jgi:hypothetical protein
MKGYLALRRINVPGLILVSRFGGGHHWPDLGGHTEVCSAALSRRSFPRIDLGSLGVSVTPPLWFFRGHPARTRVLFQGD